MEKLVQQFRDIQPTLRKNEVWRFADFSALLTDDLQISHGERQTAEYHCNIPDLDTLRLVVENGYCHMPLLQTEQGMVVAGLRDICGSRPDFVRQFFGTCTPLPNPYLQLNSDNYSDGLFVYVPDGLHVQPQPRRDALQGHADGLPVGFPENGEAYVLSDAAAHAITSKASRSSQKRG